MATQWQKDATGAPIRTGLPVEGRLGGKRELGKLLAMQSEGLAIYLDVNVNRMASSAWGSSWAAKMRERISLETNMPCGVNA